MTPKAIEMFRGWIDALCDERWFCLYGDGLCVAALFVAKYGAGFTWRQILIGLVAFAVWHSGADILRRSALGRKFQRVQFRISLTNFRQALVDAGICSEDEVRQNNGALWESLGAYSSGDVRFTWLEQNLFFLNQSGLFTDRLKLTIGLKPFGARVEQVEGRWLRDCIELRGRGDAYELVLLKAENREWGGVPGRPEGPSLLLMTLPNDFLLNLQKPVKRKMRKIDAWHAQQRTILERAGVKYCEDHEGGASYQTPYASLDWWPF